MKYFPNVKCPYCSTHQTITVDTEDHSSYPLQVVTCDLEDGGCELPFVVTVVIDMATIVRGIEGIKEDWFDVPAYDSGA